MPANPGDFAYFAAGEPFAADSKSSTTGADYFAAGEAFGAVIVVSAAVSYQPWIHGDQIEANGGG